MKLFISIIFIFINILAVDRFVISFEKVEIFGLVVISNLGFGLDEGAQNIFQSNKERYHKLMIEMLKLSEPNSLSELATFTFGELLFDNPEFKARVTEISENHTNITTRCFWHDTLNHRFERVQVQVELDSNQNSGSNRFVMYQVVDNGSTCNTDL